MHKILIATHNQGKLKRYKNLFSDFIDLDIVSLQDLNINIKIDEPFDNPKDNSIFKAKEYAKISFLPTIAIDEALTTNFLPKNEQPGVFVRRFNKDKRELSDVEVLDIWKKIDKVYLGQNRQFIWDFRLSYYNPENNILKTAKAVQKDYFTDIFSDKINPGYPMSSFLVPDGYTKPYVELNQEDLSNIDKKKFNSFYSSIAGYL
ncbi:non-canonical purine NTP pyrophosphatase [Candidatus Falkowbacteria bacterium]|nr:non-canonical purine NTP pyrophosphatase [Candidatus Falkowbacteria bacterium]